MAYVTYQQVGSRNGVPIYGPARGAPGEASYKTMYERQERTRQAERSTEYLVSEIAAPAVFGAVALTFMAGRAVLGLVRFVCQEIWQAAVFDYHYAKRRREAEKRRKRMLMGA